MISTEKGIVTIRGSHIEIISDLSTIIHAVYKSFEKKVGAEGAKSDINYAYEEAMKAVDDPERFEKESKEAKKMLELLKLLGGDI